MCRWPSTPARPGVTDVSIDVLGYIVQVVSGQPFDEFLKERIFTPLGMIDTDFWVPPEKVARFASMYGPSKEDGLKVIPSPDGKDYTKPDRALSGGGGLVSTLGDYFRFGQMLLNERRVRWEAFIRSKDGRVDNCGENHLPVGMHLNDEAWNGFGLVRCSWTRNSVPAPGSVGKFGWGGAANTEWWIDPAEELNCILMLQYMPGFTIPIVDDFNQLVYAALE